MAHKKITYSIGLICLLSLSACQTTASNPPGSQAYGSTQSQGINAKTSNIAPQEPSKSMIKLDNFLIQTSEKHKIPLNLLKDAYRDIKPQASARKLVSPPPSSAKKNWTAHRKLIIDPVRLSAGEKFWRENQAFLEKTERETGVPIEIIVGIIGIETMYGSNMGNFPVQDVLTTLAFDYPPAANKEMRETMFTQQLEDLTVYCWEQSGSPTGSSSASFKNCLKQSSSFAGAIGMPQFMPTSIRKFAKDGNGDGVIDLRRSKEDAMASVANFMIAHGWQKNQPVFLEIPNNEKALSAAQSLADGNPDPKHTLTSLKEKGIVTQWPKPLQGDHLALIVDLPTNEKNGNSFVEYVVGLKNFEVITLYNRSFFYAKVVTDFGYAVGQRVRGSVVAKDATTKEAAVKDSSTSKDEKKSSTKKKAKKT
jgi:membrane-bound lytic murein transglycosylase B